MLAKTLVLFSGLPGCGKTTLARRTAQYFGIPLFAKDRLQSVLRRQALAPRATTDGYRLILDLADEQLSLGISAILDGVFPMAGFRTEAQEIASRHHAQFVVIYCYCSDTALWKQHIQNRVQYVPHWSPVGWDEVEHLQASFEPWPPGKAIFIDAVNDIDSNFTYMIQLLEKSSPAPHNHLSIS